MLPLGLTVTSYTVRLLRKFSVEAFCRKVTRTKKVQQYGFMEPTYER
jgi:hypothetical protein